MTLPTASSAAAGGRFVNWGGCVTTVTAPTLAPGGTAVGPGRIGEPGCTSTAAGGEAAGGGLGGVAFWLAAEVWVPTGSEFPVAPFFLSKYQAATQAAITAI